jgi:hypothetical protein
MPVILTEMSWVYGAGSFPGAACCKLIDLPCYKAAPLQGVGAAWQLYTLSFFCVLCDLLRLFVFFSLPCVR